jgi:thiaminase/transcriptional activator TenA
MSATDASAAAAGRSFCEALRAGARTTWDAALDHRFFREVAADTVADEVYARYLGIEYGFVDAAARVLGHAVARAPSFRERRHLALNLHGLVTDQERVFSEAFNWMRAARSAGGAAVAGRLGRAARALPRRRGDGRL